MRTKERRKTLIGRKNTSYSPMGHKTFNVSQFAQKEKGITLIALIIMIILIVILAAVTIKGLTGKEGLLATSTKVANEYIVKQNQEQIEILLQSIILEDAVKGKATTLDSIAERMMEEDWIESAVPGESDIIVTTTDGYVYNVYYDETTGQQGIDFSGTQGGAGLPTLSASYDKIKAIITANASSEDGIKKIELIYKDQVVQTVDTNTATFEVEETGWYQVKATSNNGKTRSSWIRVSSTVVAPNIQITSENAIENGWYGKDKKAVEIVISTQNETATGIYYKTNADVAYTYAAGKTANISINKSGRTIIYAYTVDKKGNGSDISTKEIKYDSIAPELGNIGVGSGTEGLNGWYTSNVELVVRNVLDGNSGVAGYYYWEGSTDVADIDKTWVSSTDRSVRVTSEGEKVLSFQAKDNAGNKSNIRTMTIKKDSEKPNAFEPSIVEGSIGADRFTITAGTSDDTSGLLYYNFYVNGSPVAQKTTENTITVTGQRSQTTYNITVEAVDNAGNVRTGTGITVTTTKVGKPVIAMTSSGTSENGWYGKDDQEVVLTITATNANATKVCYKNVTDTNYTTINSSEATVRIRTTGTYKIQAYTEDQYGNASEVEVGDEIQYDNTHPSIGDIDVTGTRGTINGTETGWYISDTVTLRLNNITDGTGGSGIVGYYYWEIPAGSATDDVSEDRKTYVAGTSGTIEIAKAKEGTLQFGFTAKDRAGNISSAVKTLTVKKDSNKPGAFTPTISDQTTTGFIIGASSADSTSGIKHYNFYVKNESTVVKQSLANTTGSFAVTGLTEKVSYTIEVQAVDNAGNITTGTTTGTTAGIVATPTVTISPATPNGSNSWYNTGNITVTINDSTTDANKTGVTKIVYTLDGNQTQVNGRTATVTISTDGTHTIKAYATDGSKNSTETTTYTIKRDVTDPSTASLGTPTNVTATGMTVQATAADATSGIATYKFQASTVNTFASIAKETTAQTSNSYTFSGLTSGTTYYIRVIVTDNAGKTKTSATVTQATVTAGKPPEELEKTEYAGKYVDYKPAGSNYTVSSTYSGTSSNQTFSANNNMKWRIWGVQGNKLLLISETLAGSITFQAANGYNNAVKILNDACATAFGNSTYGSAITVRSINQDDIDKVTNMTTDAQRKAVNSSYGTTYTPSYKSCPKIYDQEPGKTGGGSLNRSSQSSWVTGTSSFTTGKYTYYNYSITSKATNTIYDALLTNPTASSTTGTDNHSTYWVASRCVEVLSTHATFDVFIVYQRWRGRQLLVLLERQHVQP